MQFGRAVQTTRDTTMHTPHADFKSLLNIFRFSSDDETRARQCKPEPEAEPATQPDATILAELLRARALMVRIESSGVKFPDQIYDVFVQALSAYDQKCWTEQIDRSFCITLSLLESIARHRRGAAAKRAVCTDVTLVNHDNRGQTVIISERRDGLNGLDGNW
ncbi:hypothetical protein [Paraburkholderia sp. J10-1]|uniref:hypothetical protein n=1 Tax=Paraburkholderia sp. J10-1 TaxID=2805430 RepID=UPI002AB752F0|nr:hypothetical protein [Paraburkholderia sp. J10-1]